MVKPLFHKDCGLFIKKKNPDSQHLPQIRIQIRFFFNFETKLLWSWRGSNPRPNKETIRFLHAYSGLRFSCADKTRTTHLRLIP